MGKGSYRAQSSDGRTVEIVEKRPDPARQSVLLIAADGEEFVPAPHGVNIVPLRSLTEEPSSEQVVEEEPREPTPRRKASKRKKPPAGDAAALGSDENGGEGDATA